MLAWGWTEARIPTSPGKAHEYFDFGRKETGVGRLLAAGEQHREV